ncbi:hypothetical protein ACFVU3_35670 [Streptomyces sp. NPDC058052]|uniref:hypothetical protein n=1 Tax=Streptomyces sp. NPDC058052 TaxID=3346316 RepID=UPI0036E3BB0D
MTAPAPADRRARHRPAVFAGDRDVIGLLGEEEDAWRVAPGTEPDAVLDRYRQEAARELLDGRQWLVLD